jgi:hypothetical protein
MRHWTSLIAVACTLAPMRRNGRAIAGESLRPARDHGAIRVYVCVFSLRHKVPLRADHLRFSYSLASVEFQRVDPRELTRIPVVIQTRIARVVIA